MSDFFCSLGRHHLKQNCFHKEKNCNRIKWNTNKINGIHTQKKNGINFDYFCWNRTGRRATDVAAVSVSLKTFTANVLHLFAFNPEKSQLAHKVHKFNELFHLSTYHAQSLHMHRASPPLSLSVFLTGSPVSCQPNEKKRGKKNKIVHRIA